MKVTRREFLKATTAIGATAAIGGCAVSRKSDLAEMELVRSEGRRAVISDVDGHSQCRMIVNIEDGQVTEVKGDPDDPEGKGQLTLRGKHSRDILYAPDRLKYPMKRVGKRGEGNWERISWDEALDTIARKLNEVKKEYGPEAIDFHYGHYHSGDISSYLARLAHLIGTPNISTPNHVCHVPRIFLQWLFDFGAVMPPDVMHSKCIIIWGGNPENTNKPQSIAMEKARERGAKLIVIDPRATSCAQEADIHAQLRPGTDGALALGILNAIIKEGLYDKDFVKEWTLGFDKLEKHIEDYSPEKVSAITWVPTNKIKEIARMYANTKPACISARNALDQHTNSSCAIRSIDILMAVTGNLDIKGGNVIEIPIVLATEDVSLGDKLQPEAWEKNIGADKCLFSRIFRQFASTHTPCLWDAIIHGEPYPVRAMFVMAANPALTCANSEVVQEALRKLDFLAVADIFTTSTTELADIVLPACTFLEKTRYVTYSTHADHWWNSPSRIALSPKVVEPLGESRSDWDIICELGRKMGYDEYFPWKTREEAIDYELKPFGIDCQELREHPGGVVISVPPFLYKNRGILSGIKRGMFKMIAFRDYPFMYRKYKARGFLTSSKKVEIYSEKLKKHGYDPLPVYREPAESPASRPDLAEEYPLILIGGSKLKEYTHSMMRNIPALHDRFPENLLEINPETAARLKIEHGDAVRVSSPRGSIKCAAYVTDCIDPRVVHLCYGFKESNCNILTDNEAFDPITGSTGLKSLLCRVEKV